MKVVVVGAGVIGLSCAYELTEAGVDVTVLDSGEAGAGASAGNAGWITPFLSSPRAAPGALGDAIRSVIRPGGPARIHPHLSVEFTTWAARFLRASSAARSALGAAALQSLASHAHDHFDRLQQRGVRFEAHSDGLGVVFKESRNLDAFLQTAQQVRSRGYTGEIDIIPGSEVSTYDPAIRADVAGVVHLRTERHVRPESLTRGLTEAISVNGGEVRTQITVERITRGESGGWITHTVDRDLLRSDRVVVAAGYPTRRLLHPLDIRVPLEVAKGISVTAAGEGVAPRHPLKFFERMVACSPFDGAVRLSGTFDVGRRDRGVDPKRLEVVVRDGLSYLQTWRPTTLELEWAGHRPTSADDLPIIGPVAGLPGLYLATGHGTLGVTLGPVTGALVAEEIVKNSEHELLRPFRLDRFGVF